MSKDKAARVLFAYFERPAKEYAKVLKSIKAAGGLNREEIEKIRTEAPAIHADAILRQLAVSE